MNTRPLLAGCVAGVVAFAGGASVTYAQSAQPFSVQASLLATQSEAKFGAPIGKVKFTGFGVELQGRYTWVSPWSLGVGLQVTAGSEASGVNELLVGGFVEPRFSFDVGSDRFAPYAAARVGYLKDIFTVSGFSGDISSNVLAYGIGGGLLVRMSKIVNIDVGAAVTNNDASGSSLGNYSFVGFVVKAGVSVGFGTR